MTELCAAALSEEIPGRGYDGGVSIMNEFTYQLRRRRREPVVRFQTPLGRQAQVDWRDLCRPLSDDAHPSSQPSIMVLSFSLAIFSEAVTSADLDSFLGGHMRALTCLSGTPAEVLKDSNQGRRPGVATLSQSLRPSPATGQALTQHDHESVADPRNDAKRGPRLALLTPRAYRANHLARED